MDKVQYFKDLLIILCDVGVARSIAVFAVYLDECYGGNRDKGEFAIGGCIARARDLLSLIRQWQDTLDKHGMERFHASDFTNPCGPYKDWSADQVKAAMVDFCEVINSNDCWLLGRSLNMKDFGTVKKDFSSIPITQAHVVLDTCVAALCHWLGRVPKFDPISIIVEEGLGHGSFVWKMWQDRVVRERSTLNLGDFVSGKKENHIILQVADLAANEWWRIGKDIRKRGVESFKSLEDVKRASMRSIFHKFLLSSGAMYEPEIRKVFRRYSEEESLDIYFPHRRQS